MTRRSCRARHVVVSLLLWAAAWLFGHPAVAQPSVAADVWNYRVAAGDTLISICAQFLERPEDWPLLKKLNNVANERQLQPQSVLRIPLAWVRQTATVADVVFVKGPVTASASGQAGSAAARPLAIGDTVQARDTIRTPGDASVSLRLADRSRLLIMPGSEVRIVHLLQLGRSAVPMVTLQIEAGGTEVEVAPAVPNRSFEIRTPAVNLGVRGTDFRARVDPAAKVARVEVREGRVGAESGQQQLAISGGFGTIAEQGRPIEEPRQLIAAPDLAPLERRLERLPLTLAWSPVPGAIGYRAQVLARGEPDRLLLDGRFEQPSARWPELPDGNYRFRVRALDSRGNEGLDANADVVVDAKPEAPFTMGPPDGSAMHGDSTRFEWGRVAGAYRYRLQVATSPDFRALVHDDATIEDNGTAVRLAPGSYHWRVASIARGKEGRDDIGPFGNPVSFVQRAIPPEPDLQAPQPSADGIVMRWTAPPAGHQIRFQLAADREFSRVLIDRKTDQATSVLPKPAPGSYFIRASTIDPAGFEGPFGTVQQFDVPPPPAAPPPVWPLLLPLLLLL